MLSLVPMTQTDLFGHVAEEKVEQRALSIVTWDVLKIMRNGGWHTVEDLSAQTGEAKERIVSALIALKRLPMVAMVDRWVTSDKSKHNRYRLVFKQPQEPA